MVEISGGNFTGNWKEQNGHMNVTKMKQKLKVKI